MHQSTTVCIGTSGAAKKCISDTQSHTCKLDVFINPLPYTELDTLLVEQCVLPMLSIEHVAVIRLVKWSIDHSTTTFP